jgi:hypothetical protein
MATIRKTAPAIATLALLMLVAGCATPQAQLRDGLIGAGLPKRQSACMADRMVDKLSLFQLRRISALRNFKDDKLSEMSLDRFMRNIRSLKDPEIVTVTTRAALGCAISG